MIERTIEGKTAHEVIKKTIGFFFRTKVPTLLE